MGALTDYAQNKISDSMRRAQTFPSLPNLHFTLLTCTHGARGNSTAYSLNNTIAVLANDGKYHLYKVTTAGTTAAAQSTLYPGNANEAITDGTAVLTEQSSALDAGSAIVEPSGGSYARVQVAASLANFSGTQGAGTTTASTGTSGTQSNNGAITFPTPSADWTSGSVRVWGWAWYDASTSGNCWEWGPLTALQSILNGQAAPSFAAGALSMTIGN